MRYFIVRISKSGDLTFVMEGPGPAPPRPPDRPVCWRIMYHRNGRLSRQRMPVEEMALAIAEHDQRHPGELAGTEKGSFESLDQVERWMCHERFEHDITRLERDIEAAESERDRCRLSGDEVGAKRQEHKIESLWKRVLSLQSR